MPHLRHTTNKTHDDEKNAGFKSTVLFAAALTGVCQPRSRIRRRTENDEISGRRRATSSKKLKMSLSGAPGTDFRERWGAPCYTAPDAPAPAPADGKVALNRHSTSCRRALQRPSIASVPDPGNGRSAERRSSADPESCPRSLDCRRSTKVKRRCHQEQPASNFTGGRFLRKPQQLSQ